MRDRFFGPMWGLVAVGLFLLWLALASGGCAKPRPQDQPGARPPAIVQVWTWIKPVVRQVVEQGLGALVDALFGAEAAPESGRLAFADLDAGRLTLARGSTSTVLIQSTQGKAIWRFDLSEFKTAPDLDSYAGITACWQDPKAPVRPKDRPITPCMQLGLRGTNPEPCVRKPCNGKVALEVRYTANLRFDGTGIPETAMCGQGTKANAWLTLAPGPIIDVQTEWAPGGLVITTPTDRRVLVQGAAPGNPPGSTAIPGFGWWTEGIPPGGVGYSYKTDWTLQAHGGRAGLIYADGSASAPPLGTCP